MSHHSSCPTEVLGSTLLVYDYIITLNDEIKYIWRSQRSVGKYLFLFVRYLPFLDVTISTARVFILPPVSETACLWLYAIPGYALEFGVLAADVIVGLRTWAIWGRKLAHGILLLVTFLGIYSSGFYFIATALSLLHFSVSPFPSILQSCFLTSAASPSSLAAQYIQIVVYEAIVFVATLVKGIQHIMRGSTTSLFTVVYRDGLLFSGCLFALSLSQVLVIMNAPPDLAFSLVPIQRVMHAILPARVVLHLRKAIPTMRQEASGSVENIALHDRTSDT